MSRHETRPNGIRVHKKAVKPFLRNWKVRYIVRVGRTRETFRYLANAQAFADTLA